jgi:hypothetical protein
MRAEGVSRRHAVELLQAGYEPSVTPTRTAPPRASSVPKLPAPVTAAAEDDQAVLRQVVAYYHATLQHAPEARRYLAGRGLQSAEFCAHFQLGFANRTLGYRLPQKNRRAGAALRGSLQRLGLFRASGHEHFSGALVIPIVTPGGTVVQLVGRKIGAHLDAGAPRYLTLPDRPPGIWNEEALGVSEPIILCASLFDAFTFWVAGFRQVVASEGGTGLAEPLQAALQTHGVTTVLLAYGSTPAQARAARAHADRLLALGIACFRVAFPPGMDANEVARTGPSGFERLGELLRTAVWMGHGTPPALDWMPPSMTQTAGPAVPAPATDRPRADAPAPSATVAVVPDDDQGSAGLSPAGDPGSTLSAPAPGSADPPSSGPSLVGPEPSDEGPPEIHGEEIILHHGDRRYRIRGLGTNLSYALLKVNVLVSGPARPGASGFHVDTLDLYAARQRAGFLKQASVELRVPEDVLRRELGRVLLTLEGLQEAQIQRALTPQPAVPPMSEPERTAALELLRDPHLLDRIQADFAHCGVVGEETTVLVGYLAAVSRLLDAPLALLIQSSSAAGKSWLLDAILACVPPEHQVQYSALTGQALFYLGATELKHKVLAITEEAGARRAAYALKLLQSAGALTIASTGKDPATGRLVAHPYRVEGPVMLCLTTTAIDLDEELVNRCLVLTVNEDPAQTQAIHQQQREAQTLEGLLHRQERQAILAVHRNAQRLLQPTRIINPYARALTFRDGRLRARRDHGKYLTLIQAITLLHQYQRPTQTVRQGAETLEYLEVTPADIAIATRLLDAVLGRTLDELPPQTQRLLGLLDAMVAQQCAAHQAERAAYRFTRKDVRAGTGWSDSQLKRHLHRLEDLEYLLVHHGGRGQRFVYELVGDYQEGGAAPMLPGLIDGETLPGCASDGKQFGTAPDPSPPGLPPVRGVGGGGVGSASPVLAAPGGDRGTSCTERTVREQEALSAVPVPVAEHPPDPNDLSRAPREDS